MTRALLLAVVCLLSTTAHGGARFMPPEDPNLDPAWNWRTQDEYVLYSSMDGGTPEQHFSQLPYYQSGNILTSFQTPDMYPEDGWVLVHRDFGTPRSAPPFPYFTLYNRYRGIFRVMLFNAQNREGTYFLGQISFLEGRKYPEARAGLFTFADGHAFKESLETYDPEVKLAAVSRMTAYRSWAVFDFPLVGFDPDLKVKDPVLVFRLASVEKQDLELQSAGSIQLFQAVENRTDGEEARPGFTLTPAALSDAGSKGFATYRTEDAFIKNELLSKAGEENHKNEVWFGAAKAIAKSSMGAYAPLIAGLGAAVESFLGGANKASQWEHLNFRGQLQFSSRGAIKTTKELWFQDFFLNPGQRDGRAQRPLQEVPWGVFNFTRLPQGRETFVPYLRNAWNGADVTWKLAEPPPLVVNPEAGLELTSVRVRFVRTDRNGVDKVTSEYMTVQDAMEKGYRYDRVVEAIHGTGSIWELRFQTKNPTRFADREILIVKKVGDW